MLGVGILATATAPAMLYLGCALFGLGVGNTPLLPGLLVQQEFPKQHFARIVSLSCRDQPVQFRVWTELTRRARARRRQLRHRAACLPVDGSTGGAHCHLARGNSLQEGAPSQRLGVEHEPPEVFNARFGLGFHRG
jgi:hypothetical protein